MKTRSAAVGSLAILSLCSPAFAVPSLDGVAENFHAEAAFMDGVGAPSGSAAVLASAAAGKYVPGLALSSSAKAAGVESEAVPAPGEASRGIDGRIARNGEFLDGQQSIISDVNPGFWHNVKNFGLSAAMPFTLAYGFAVSLGLNAYKDYGLLGAAAAAPIGAAIGLVVGACLGPCLAFKSAFTALAGGAYTVVSGAYHAAANGSSRG